MKKLCYLLSLCTLIFTCGPEDSPLEQAPEVSQISPEFIEAGTEVLIVGDDLNNEPKLTFNDHMITPTKITNNAITFILPENASSGPLSIEFDMQQYNIEAYLKVLDPNWSVEAASDYIQIEFLSNTTGFASRVDNTLTESRIDKTSDGGQTWTTIFQEDVADFFFTTVDANVVYAKGNTNIFKKSTDGGATWDDFTVLDLSYHITNMFFSNALEGFLLADKQGQSYVFKTQDGGTSWEEKLALNTSTANLEVTYRNETTIYLLNRDTDELLKTEDRGENWTVTNLGILTGNRLQATDFVNEQNAWLYMNSLIENSGGLYHSNSIENGWEEIQIPELSNVDEHISKIHFINELTGYLVTNYGGILYTDNAGESWQLRYIDVEHITAINAFGNNIYIIADGHLFKK